MNRYLLPIAGCVCFCFASVADAQLRVGPFGGVNLRVPFVSVDVLPFGGGTRVRAPLTSVNTGLYGLGYSGYSRYGLGGYGYGAYSRPYSAYRYDYGYPGYGYRDYHHPHFYDQGYYDHGYIAPHYRDPYTLGYHAYPVPRIHLYPDSDVYAAPYVNPMPNDVPVYEAARPIAESVPASLRSAAERLAAALSRRPDDADVWMDYLKPDLIIDSLDRNESPESLRELLRNYEGLSGNSELSHIWTVDGFRQTHHLLSQWITSGEISNSASEPALIEDAPSILERTPEWSEPAEPKQDLNLDAATEELPVPSNDPDDEETSSL